METSTENLVDSIAIIKQYSYALKKYINDSSYEDVLSTTILLLNELKNGALSPKDYYEVWMAVCDQLIVVESFFCDVLQSDVTGEELYEQVQYTQAFIPRLYLMIVVGSCCIRLKLIPAKRLLYDILEMCKGIQHPTRGLFLRNFFIREMKDKFPYPGCRYETEDGGDLNDSVDCILRNFVEMNRLWIRMQKSKSGDLEKREAERKDLKVLVGSSFVYLSQLEGYDANYYNSRILPALINEIISCGDSIAQQYLLESIIQVFPEDFQIMGLNNLLECFCHMNDTIDIGVLFQQLLERIQGYNHEQVEDSTYLSIRDSVLSFLREMKNKQSNLPLNYLLSLEHIFLQFIIKNKKENMEDVAALYAITVDYLKSVTVELVDCSSTFIAYMNQPIAQYGLSLLSMQSYIDTYNSLPVSEASVVASAFADLILTSHHQIKTKEEADRVFTILSSLYKREELSYQHLFSRCLYALELEEQERLEVINGIFNRIVEGSKANSRYIPLITIVSAVLKDLCAADNTSQFYDGLELMLRLVKKVHVRNSIYLTLDTADILYAKKDIEGTKRFIELALSLYEGLETKHRVCTKLAILSHLADYVSIRDESREYADRVIQMGKVILLIQGAIAYSMKAETNAIYDEDEAKSLLKEAEQMVEEKPSGKEKTALQVIFLEYAIRLNSANSSMFTREQLSQLFRVIMDSKMSRSTKTTLEGLKMFIL